MLRLHLNHRYLPHRSRLCRPCLPWKLVPTLRNCCRHVVKSWRGERKEIFNTAEQAIVIEKYQLKGSFAQKNCRFRTYRGQMMSHRSIEKNAAAPGPAARANRLVLRSHPYSSVCSQRRCHYLVIMMLMLISV